MLQRVQPKRVRDLALKILTTALITVAVCGPFWKTLQDMLLSTTCTSLKQTVNSHKSSFNGLKKLQRATSLSHSHSIEPKHTMRIQQPAIRRLTLFTQTTTASLLGRLAPTSETMSMKQTTSCGHVKNSLPCLYGTSLGTTLSQRTLTRRDSPNLNLLSVGAKTCTTDLSLFQSLYLIKIIQTR